ncbi:YncE family protein [Bacillus cereus]|uniref:YncE family protein n=1 Tax=Bacillus cereus TaxID=1396 RepID=UPI000BEE251B|nr:hypothetical protein [Bacillus cereus]PEF60475.1 hypothetical protein CON35_30685 [Bacillus cereus]
MEATGPINQGIGKGRIYVSNRDSNNVSVIDENTNIVMATVTVGTNPQGIGMNLVTNRIYVANTISSNISVIDGNTNTVIATVGVGVGPFGVV